MNYSLLLPADIKHQQQPVQPSPGTGLIAWIRRLVSMFIR